jgi:hypothetical protein
MDGRPHRRVPRGGSRPGLGVMSPLRVVDTFCNSSDMTFTLAKQYGTEHGLIEQSSRFPQGVQALKTLVGADVWAEFDWNAHDHSAFDHTRVFVKSANARFKAWRVGFGPYPPTADRTVFQEVADLLHISVSLGDEAHRTYSVPATMPVMYFRRS